MIMWLSISLKGALNGREVLRLHMYLRKAIYT